MHPLSGKKQSPEHIAKRVAAVKAAHALNPLKRKWTEERREAQRIKMTGKKFPDRRPHSEETKAKIAAAMKGKQNCLGHKPSEEHRRKLAAFWAENREKHNHYVDGKGHERNGERIADMGRIEYRLWRESVFARDNWTCVLCGSRGGKIHADHIKPYAWFPELRYAIDNGRTLCVPCHRQQPTSKTGGKRPEGVN